MLEEVIFLERRKEAASEQRQAWFGVLKNSLYLYLPISSKDSF